MHEKVISFVPFPENVFIVNPTIYIDGVTTGSQLINLYISKRRLHYNDFGATHIRAQLVARGQPGDALCPSWQITDNRVLTKNSVSPVDYSESGRFPTIPNEESGYRACVRVVKSGMIGILDIPITRQWIGYITNRTTMKEHMGAQFLLGRSLHNFDSVLSGISGFSSDLDGIHHINSLLSGELLQPAGGAPKSVGECGYSDSREYDQKFLVRVNKFFGSSKTFENDRENRAKGALFIILGFIAGMILLIRRVNRENDAINNCEKHDSPTEQ